MSILLAGAAVLAFIVAAALSALSDILKEEIRGWIEVLPGIVLRMAAMRLPADQRVRTYRDLHRYQDKATAFVITGSGHAPRILDFGGNIMGTVGATSRGARKFRRRYKLLTSGQLEAHITTSRRGERE